MRELFIEWSEKLLAVFLVLLMVAVTVAGFGAIFAGLVWGHGMSVVVQGIGILVGGAIYTIILGGMMYLFFGIYRNTQKTNALLEDLLRK